VRIAAFEVGGNRVAWTSEYGEGIQGIWYYRWKNQSAKFKLSPRELTR